nr:hypothetical protein Iba_scaffold273518CG0010 [Ipomoea batatas]
MLSGFFLLVLFVACALFFHSLLSKLMDITICAWDILLVKQGHGARRGFPYSMTISKVIIGEWDS